MRTKEHPYYKNKRMEELSESKKSYLVSIYEEEKFSEIKKYAKELGVVYNTLMLKIRYWHFQKNQLKY